METSEARLFKALEKKNTRLKKSVTELSPDMKPFSNSLQARKLEK